MPAWQLLVFLGQQKIRTCRKPQLPDGAELLSIEPWIQGAAAQPAVQDMACSKLWNMPGCHGSMRSQQQKGAIAPFSCLPARTGSGRARYWVKGLVPCGFLGQRPKPSESFSASISAIFKVLLSLFFSTQFFIDYLTLPVFWKFIFKPWLVGIALHSREEAISSLRIACQVQSLYHIS